MKTSQVAVLALAATPVISETIRGAIIFTRHADRETRMFKGYQLTNLGAQQLYASGSYYRSRYIEDGAPLQIAGIASAAYDHNQLWASAPAQGILQQTTVNFLQGLYPPLGTLNQTSSVETLANGSAVADPLNGYQFIQVNSEDEAEPDHIWLKGSDLCPTFTAVSATYKQSAEFRSISASSASFYGQFNATLGSIIPNSTINYGNAYNVFDLLNVARIHNNSAIVTTEQLNQLRYYADSLELALNYNQSQPMRSVGGKTLGGLFLRQLNATIKSTGELKLSVLGGSYNTFLAFFGLTNLTGYSNDFLGLPDYGSTMVLELFSSSDAAAFPATSDLNVRFLFRNGTDSRAVATPFPLFGQTSTTLSYNEFQRLMTERAIVDPNQWCTSCSTTAGFCSQAEYLPATANSSNTSTNSGAADSPRTSNTASESASGLTVVQAGVVGAMVTLAVALIVAGVAYVLLRKRSGRKDRLEKVASPQTSISGGSV